MVNTFLKPGQASWDSSFKASSIGVNVTKLRWFWKDVQAVYFRGGLPRCGSADTSTSEALNNNLASSINMQDAKE